MNTPEMLQDLVMPEGWFCVNTSPTGVGMYERWIVREISGAYASRFRDSSYRQTTKYRVVFNGFCGGWTIQEQVSRGSDWTWFMDGVAFPSAVGAMLALEIELSNNKA